MDHYKLRDHLNAHLKCLTEYVARCKPEDIEGHDGSDLKAKKVVLIRPRNYLSYQTGGTKPGGLTQGQIRIKVQMSTAQIRRYDKILERKEALRRGEA